MRVYPAAVKFERMKAQKLESQLKATAQALLSAVKEAREARTPEERKEALQRAERFRAYLARLGKNIQPK